MYSHSVMKNENTLNYHVDQTPTNDVMMVVDAIVVVCETTIAIIVDIFPTMKGLWRWYV